MTTTTPFDYLSGGPVPEARHHTRTKSSVLRSFIGHKRNNSHGTNLPSSFAANIPLPSSPGGLKSSASIDPIFLRDLDDLTQCPSNPARSPTRQPEGGRQSPTKNMGFTFKSLAAKESSSRLAGKMKGDGGSPTKPKKTKSSTNLAGLLSRPKSSKNLNKLVTEEEAARAAKDKENRTPPSTMAAVENNQMMLPPPPIFAQFSSQQPGNSNGYGSGRGEYTTANGNDEGAFKKARPMSYQPPYVGPRQDEIKPRTSESRDRPIRSNTDTTLPEQRKKGNTWGRGGTASRGGVLGVFPGMGSRTQSAIETTTTSTSTATTGSTGSNTSSRFEQPTQPVIAPKDIDEHLEAMLDRRNIPENQRYKMRNLNSTIKMEFIRQDWAETAGGKMSQDSKRPGTGNGGSSDTSSSPVTDEKEKDTDDGGKKKKHGRGRSLTLTRAIGQIREKSQSRGPSSPSKKKSEGTLGRHFRSKSTESVSGDSRPASSSSGVGGLVAKLKGSVAGVGPLDFVAYLRKVQKPELVEVGKLHKLRLLLRNETVAWAEEFIREGGMKEVVDLLHRIMEVEWREEHEDALLHENLLCLKALCTTSLALEYLHAIHATLFPALLHMIFDPEKKGPSEFTTRNIITSVLLTYIEAGVPGPDRTSRATAVLSYLRDPDAPEEAKPVSFVLEMRKERPYRVWCKEVVSVTKEVFWIFLHNLNVIALDKPADATPPIPSATDDPSDTTYMTTHFPRPRAPVPAAPYVGGVEWDATNYLASHLDLLNAIISCTPTREARNELRGQLRISGWERCLGGSLRLCKEKFYGAVHEALRAWVAAAYEDGWDVRDVRYGPPPEQKKSRSVSPVKRKTGGEQEAAPKIEMPKLDFGVDALRVGEGKAAGGQAKGREDDFWRS